MLRNVPLLAGLADDQLEQLVGRVRRVRVPAGSWVMREGEAAHSMYIIRTGQLEAVDVGPPESVINLMRRGEVIGELALLRQATRTASVRARRDAELLELERESFDELIRSLPGFALGLTRALGERLASRPSVAAPANTIGVLDVDGGQLAGTVADQLVAALRQFGSVEWLRTGDLAVIDRAENSSDKVVLSCSGAPDDPWTDACVTEAHVLVALSRGGLSRFWREHITQLQGCELLVLGRGLEAGVFASLQPREVHVVIDRGSEAEAEAVRSLARRLAGRALGIVLSGGGAAAFAHVGVVSELLESGLRFDRAAGVSLGSLVAGAVAADYTPEELYEVFERNFVATNPTNDFTLPVYSLLRGAKTRRLLRRVAGNRRIEELPRRFFCVSCDLVRHEAVVHRVGLAADAIYASLAIPGVFPPLATEDGRLLVDGGVIDNLPVSRMARSAGPVIAVDVTSGISGRPSAGRPGIAPLRRAARRALTGNELPTPHLGATIVRAITAGRTDVHAARLVADVVIAPAVDGVGPTDWKSLPRAVELGRQAARKALVEHAQLSSWTWS